MPIGSSAWISAIARSMLLAERQDVAALAHRDPEPDRRLAVDAEHRLRRVDIAAPDLATSPRRTTRSPTTKLTARMSSSESNAPETRSESRSSPVCRTPAGRTAFCAWSAATSAG